MSNLRCLGCATLGIVCSCLLGMVACKSGSAELVRQAAPAASAGGVESFGAPLKAAQPVALTQILDDPDAFAGKEVTVEAKVRRVCSRKGCWMELTEGTAANTPGCRVTFKDYGFFVPMDSAGAAARAQGIVHTKTVSASDVEHYESEGATFAHKMPDGTAREVRLVASGVELRR